MPRPDRDTIIDVCWPPTNIPTEDDVTSAAIAFRELAWYLLRCTTRPDAPAITRIGVAHAVLQNVGTAATQLAPVLHQIGQATIQQAASRPLVYDKRGTSPETTAHQAAKLLDEARATLTIRLYDQLTMAAVLIDQLNNVPEQPTEATE